MAQREHDITSPGSRGGLPAIALPPWPFWLVVAALALTWGQHFVWLVQKGWHNEYYGHGFLIPLVTAYLIYRRREELAGLPREKFALGLPLLTAGLAIHIIAVYKDVNFPQGFALVAVISGLTVWLYGWPVGRGLAFPLAFLLFMVPMGRFLVDTVAQPLQLLSATLAGGAAAFMGLPAQVHGTSIDIPDFHFEVAIACSGLKSAIAMGALGALFAYLIAGPLWKRLLIFAFSLPAALLANAIRIWLTLVLARSFGPAAAEGFFHTFSGVVVFVIALFTLFGLGSLLGCRSMRDDV